MGLADSVITALSDFARLPVPEMSPIPVEASLREVVELTGLPGGIQVTFDFPTSLPAVLGDARQLKIVFSNLVRNARDAMPQGGALAISGRSQRADVEITVADSGVGIRREDLERIMEPLYSTKARGIGLGLAITRSILDKHGGRLQVASEPGKGSRFTVRLPSAK